MKRTFAIIITVIMIFTLVSCTGSSEEDVPKGMKKLSNDILDYNLYIPERWTEEISTGVVTAKYSDSILVNISMMAMQTTEDVTTPEEYFEKYKTDFEKIYTDFEVVSIENILLDNQKASKYVYTGTLTGVAAKYMQVICIKQGIIYLFTYTASQDQYDNYLDDVNNMIDTFRFK